jgi:hypothetical protein
LLLEEETMNLAAAGAPFSMKKLLMLLNRGSDIVHLSLALVVAEASHSPVVEGGRQTENL